MANERFVAQRMRDSWNLSLRTNFSLGEQCTPCERRGSPSKENFEFRTLAAWVKYFALSACKWNPGCPTSLSEPKSASGSDSGALPKMASTYKHGRYKHETRAKYRGTWSSSKVQHVSATAQCRYTFAFGYVC